MFYRTVLAGSLLALLGAAHAQVQPSTSGSERLAPSRPSSPATPSTPSMEQPDPTTGNIAGSGSSAGVVSTPSPNSRNPQQTRSRNTGMLGPGSFGPPVGNGLENAVNSGTPPLWDRKAGVRKVCPPELENRNNICVAPVGSVLTP